MDYHMDQRQYPATGADMQSPAGDFSRRGYVRSRGEREHIQKIVEVDVRATPRWYSPARPVPAKPRWRSGRFMRTRSGDNWNRYHLARHVGFTNRRLQKSAGSTVNGQTLRRSTSAARPRPARRPESSLRWRSYNRASCIHARGIIRRARLRVVQSRFPRMRSKTPARQATGWAGFAK